MARRTRWDAVHVDADVDADVDDDANVNVNGNVNGNGNTNGNSLMKVIARKRDNVPRSPHTVVTTATAALSTLLDMSDVRYEVVYYGEFLKDLPRRMGCNEVLDAAVVALTHGYSAVHTRQPSAQALGSYVGALKTLRVALKDPAKLRNAETLCGIYLIMVCQVIFLF